MESLQIIPLRESQDGEVALVLVLDMESAKCWYEVVNHGESQKFDFHPNAVEHFTECLGGKALKVAGQV